MTSQQGNAIVSLDQYRKENYNVLVPTSYMQQISPFHRLRVEEVRVSPKPDDGEVFKVGSKKVGNNWEDVLSPAKPALMKLANAAGIIWNWNETKVLAASRDYVLYQAVGAVRKPSGEWIPLKATKEIDLTVIEEEVMESNLKKAREMEKDTKRKADLKGLTPEQWAEAHTRSNMIQWRKNKLMRAETGAMLRVIRALLNLKMQYSTGELTKPFIVPRVDFAPDYSDPEVKHMIMEHGIKATTELFGAAAGAQQLPPAQAVGQAFSQQAQMPDMGPAMDIDEFNDPIDSDDDVPPDPVPTSDDDTPPGSLFPGDTPTCDNCAEVITDKVAEYSINKYGKRLCMRCQKKEASK